MSDQTRRAPTANRKANYKPQEDVLLCQVSHDPVVGVNQSGDAFYSRVKTAFDEETQRAGIVFPDRVANGLCSRFKIISAAVSKFEGCYETAKSTQASGTTDVDVLEDALTLYEHDYGGAFKFVSCWNVLKTSMK